MFSTQYKFFSSHWLLSHITIVNRKVSGRREANPVAMNKISPQKEIGRARIIAKIPFVPVFEAFDENNATMSSIGYFKNHGYCAKPKEVDTLNYLPHNPDF